MNSRQGIIAWFARNPVAANLLMISIVILGTLSALQIRKEFFPVIETGRVLISVIYPGAAPEDVEQGVVLKIEEALQGINGLKRVQASSYEGLANLTISTLNSYSVDSVLEDIRNAVEGISTFPDEVKRPVITKETTKDGVLWLILSGSVDERSLKQIANQMKDDLINDPQISQVEIHGTRKREIRIEISEAALLKYELSFAQVTAAVRQNSMNLPAGKIETRQGDLILRADSQARTVAEFCEIPLLTDDTGMIIRLGDVGEIIDGFEEADWFLRFQGKPAVGLQIFRVGNQNSLDVAAAVHDYARQKREKLPAQVELEIIADNSVMLKNRLNLMLKNLGFGALLVFISLILFLRLRVAFWVILGLPLCFLGTIWCMPFTFIDISINMITLFGFILVLGIVVDDAIVIGESIHTTVNEKGAGVEQVIEGAGRVATAATFGVLTTIAAFLPMLFLPGINGKIWRGIGLVVILSLMFSLIESKLILPAHLSRLRPTKSVQKRRNLLVHLQEMISRILEKCIATWYQPLLLLALRNWTTTVAVFIAMLILTFGLARNGSVGFIFFPDIEGNTIEATLKLRTGTPLTKTNAVTEQLEKAASQVNDHYKQTEGYQEDVISSLIAVTLSSTEVWFYAELLPAEQRDAGANEVVQRWRAAAGEIDGVEYLKFSGSTTDSGSPVAFTLKARDPEKLQAAAQELKKILSTYEGVYDIQLSMQKGNGELAVELREGAPLLGLTSGNLARQLRQGFHGSEAQTLQLGKDEVKVRISYPAEERNGNDVFAGKYLRTDDGSAIPFAEAAKKEMSYGYASIDRIDSQRAVQVLANVNKETAEPQRIIADLEEMHIPALQERYRGLNYSLAGEAMENQESLKELKRGTILALLLIFVMMAIPLQSYLQPLIIMAAIPFGVVGAILGHLILGLPVSILSLCGIIALSGVVVNDSLVMVDFINNRRRMGKPLLAAVKEAGSARFRAILLTSLTTFLGLLPMVLEKSLQAQFLIPMSVSLGFGILFATSVTLVLVPTLYVGGLQVITLISGILKRWHGRSVPKIIGGEQR